MKSDERLSVLLISQLTFELSKVFDGTRLDSFLLFGLEVCVSLTSCLGFLNGFGLSLSSFLLLTSFTDVLKPLLDFLGGSDYFTASDFHALTVRLESTYTPLLSFNAMMLKKEFILSQTGEDLLRCKRHGMFKCSTVTSLCVKNLINSLLTGFDAGFHSSDLFLVSAICFHLSKLLFGVANVLFEFINILNRCSTTWSSGSGSKLSRSSTYAPLHTFDAVVHKIIRSHLSHRH